jgi:hypothetical protein
MAFRRKPTTVINNERPPAVEHEVHTDDAYLEWAMTNAEVSWKNIPDVAARMIASQFHGGQSSALYALASSGAIDLERLRDEYTIVYVDPQTPEDDKRKLDHLGMYVLEHGGRGPVDGWSELWGRQ